MTVFYNIAIYLYRLAVIISSPFNKKAGLWYRGRKGFFRRWKDFNPGGRRVIWMHCASLGEFEQGRPVIEKLKEREADVFILLTFFSPSGYEIRKDYPLADAVCYLPADTPANAAKFVKTFGPDMAVFVKYEFWYNYISRLRKNNIPLYLISANFRKDQIFFRWYGKWFAGILHMFSHIFVQSDDSRKLLNSLGAEQVSVAGDTRFDRVYDLQRQIREIPAADAFSAGNFTVVAGSTWPADHDLLVKFMNETRHKIKLIIAPHEINEDQIVKLESQFNDLTVRYSDVAKALQADNSPGEASPPEAAPPEASTYTSGPANDKAPESDIPETDKPESDTLESDTLETDKPESDTLETDTLETDTLETGPSKTRSSEAADNKTGSPDADLVMSSVLIIDNIGLLSSLYAYGKIAYVGGGFGKGIHNILEACTHGIPVIFGPNYRKFREARVLAETGGAFPVRNYRELAGRADQLISDKEKLHIAGSTAENYVKNNTGASRIIIDKILSPRN